MHSFIDWANIWQLRFSADKCKVLQMEKIIPGLKELTYEKRLEKMKLPCMCYRKLRGDLIEVFKYTHNIYCLSDSLLELETRTNTRGHSYKLKKRYAMQYYGSTSSHRET